MSDQLPTAYEVVRDRFTSILSHICVEMIDAGREKMSRLHNLGVEVETIQFKLMCYKRLRMTSIEPLAEICAVLDDVLYRLALEDVVGQVDQLRGTNETNPLPPTLRSTVRERGLLLRALPEGGSLQPHHR